MKRILVTGSTGNVGRAVVDVLRRRGLEVRAAGLSPEAVTAKLGADVQPVRLDLRDPTTFVPAISGCDGLFLLRPPAIANVRETLNPLVDAALATGVEHVVFLSVTGAGKNKLVPHHAVEQHVQGVTQNWTLLRPGFFAQNLGDAYRRDIVEGDRLYVPAGRGRAAFVDVRDVAEVAGLAFTAPNAHRGQAYTLTGPAAVPFREAAEVLSEALNRRIRYQPATWLGYAWHLHRRGLPAGQVAVQTILHVGLRFGQAEQVDPTLERLLGRPGRTLREYVRDHVGVWARAREPVMSGTPAAAPS